MELQTVSYLRTKIIAIRQNAIPILIGLSIYACVFVGAVFVGSYIKHLVFYSSKTVQEESPSYHRTNEIKEKMDEMMYRFHENDSTDHYVRDCIVLVFAATIENSDTREILRKTFCAIGNDLDMSIIQSDEYEIDYDSNTVKMIKEVIALKDNSKKHVHPTIFHNLAMLSILLSHGESTVDKMKDYMYDAADEIKKLDRTGCGCDSEQVGI